MMYLINPSTLSRLLSVISIAQAIILDLDSLIAYPLAIRAGIRASVEQAIPLAFTAASVGQAELANPSTASISTVATWLFQSTGKALAKINYGGITEINQYITTDETTTDYEDNPILYFSLSRLRETGRGDGALYDPDFNAYIIDRTTIEACRLGNGNQPPHFLAINNGPRRVHDVIQLCPWYVTWLSKHNWPMTSRWNSPGAVRDLTETAFQVRDYSTMTAMDYLQGLDQKLLSAMLLVRPATLSTPAGLAPAWKIWNDCIANPDPQNPRALAFFTTAVQFIQLGYRITRAGAILGYTIPTDAITKKKRSGSFIQRPKSDAGLCPSEGNASEIDRVAYINHSQDEMQI